jgi:hypothetical protein
MTTTNEIVDGQNCPSCGREFGSASPAGDTDQAAVPTPGAVTICDGCGETGVFGADLKIRPATEDELEEFMLQEDFRVARTAARKAARMRGIDGPIAIGITLGPDGEIELPDGAPSALKEILGQVFTQMKVRAMGDDIKEHVTAEVANHVLSSYGDERASMPSLACSSLISLIRLCHQSDEHLLSHLNEVQHIHGYVIAVVYLAENPPEGIEMLEMIAGFRDPNGETIDSVTKKAAEQ